MADVWGQDWFGQTKTLDAHTAALRRKLADAGRRPLGLPTGDRHVAPARLPL
jgi:DNA-binding response OmpR family regulator